MAYYKCGRVYTTQNSNVVVDNVSGAIANFNTPLSLPLIETKFGVKAIQDLNGQSGPYPAGGGINRWNEEWELGAWSSVTGDAINYTDRIRCKNLIPVLPSTSYCIRFGTTASSIVNAHDENGDFIENLTTGTFGTGGRVVTTPANCHFIKFSVGTAYGTTYNNDISVNYPSTDTDYHPYSNICPIEGVSEVKVFKRGGNLWDEQWEIGTIQTSDGQDSSLTTKIRSKGYTAVPPNTVFTYASNYGCTVFFYTKDFTYISYLSISANRTFTTPADCRYIRFTPVTAYGPTYNHDISINYPSSDTEYHAYNGTDVTIDLDGTRYGGYVTQDKDGKRAFKVTHGLLDWANLYLRRSNNAGAWANYVFFAPVSDMKYVYTAISDSYKLMQSGSVGDIDNYSFRLSFTGNAPYIYFRNDDYTDVETFRTAMQNTKLVYELETPFTIALPDGEPIKSFPGINNIFCDTGDTSLQFRKIG